MKKRHSSHQEKRKRQQLLFFLILFVCFSYFGFFLLKYTNIISGAGTSGTVNFTILASAGGGGGGGEEEEIARRLRNGGSILSWQLEVIPKEIKENLNRFEGKLVTLLLRNRGDKTFDLTLFTNVNILKIGEQRVILPPGGEQKVTVIIDTSQQGIFVGYLTIEGLFAFKQLPVLIKVGIPASYHLEVTIPPSAQMILPGQDIFADVVIAPLENGTIALTYLVKDSNNQILLQESEEANVTQQRLAFQKTFDLPDQLPFGRYYLLVQSDYRGEKTEDAAAFDVVETIGKQEEYPVQLYKQSPMIFFLIVLAILFLHLFMTHHKNKYD